MVSHPNCGRVTDVASYGVKLSSQLSQLTGNEASGFPMTLTFELLDHYNHRLVLFPLRFLEFPLHQLSTTAATRKVL